MNKYHNYKIITQKNIYTMNYFENKLKKQKDNIYKNYLKLLKKQKITLECEFINIEHSNDCLTDLINNFYEYEKIDYSKPSKKNSNIEKQNEINFETGLSNYSVIIFDYFPLDYVKKICQIFITRHLYFSKSSIYWEVKKFLYSHWKDVELQDITGQITEILVRTASLTNKEYKQILNNTSHFCTEYSSRYYVYWLYCFYPLVAGYDDLIIKLVNVVYLGDAQDELLHGIEKINSPELLPFYKKFIVAVWKSRYQEEYDDLQCFQLFCKGTGSLRQNVLIIKKLKKDLNWDIFADPDLQEFWLDDYNFKQIKCVKDMLEM